MNCNILIVEDEARIRLMLRSYFEEESWNVYEAENGLEALKTLENEDINILILDIMMPIMNGMETIKNVRKNSDINIIMLTALSDEESEIESYKYGADDFIQKPFKIKVLVAKIKRLIEKKESNFDKNLYSYKDFKIDYMARKVFLKDNEILFTPKEFDLLEYLIKHRNIVLTREQIIDQVWGIDFEGETRVIDRHILKLRNKLKYDFIKISTIISKGYRYEEL